MQSLKNDHPARDGVARTWRVVLSAALVAAFPVAAVAHNANVSAEDQKFAMMAAEGGNAEIAAAHMALRKSNNAAVDSFANRMISDHGRANAQLASIMKQENMTVPTTIDPLDRAAAARLKQLNGRQFDAAYLTAQRKAHQRTIALFREEAMKGNNNLLVSFAKRTLPVIDEHLSIDKQDLSKIHGAPVAQNQ